MIATYIQELLATNNRVIVPNYGAFLVRATSKSKDANTLEEKLKDVYFSPFLKFNDELLEKYIIKKEGMTKEQASEKITAFIDDIKKELEQEKPYNIKDFGQFVADKQGKVQFLTVAKDTEEPKEEKKVTEKATKKAAKTTSPASGKESVSKVTPTEEKKVEKPKVTEVKPARPTGKKEEPKAESKPASPAGGLKEFKPETKVETKTAPVSTQPKSIYSTKTQKKPINKGLVLSIAIGLPVAAIFIWGILNFDTIKKVVKKDKAKTEKVVKTKTEQAEPEATKETTAKAETKQTEVKKPTIPQKKYYIIAGSFKNEKYAFSYMNKLKAKGYNAEKLDERNGMHAVSFNSFTDKKKAIAEYKFLANEKGLQAWILYH
jgi:nucleoid DNA-binding protein